MIIDMIYDHHDFFNPYSAAHDDIKFAFSLGCIKVCFYFQTPTSNAK